MYKQFLELDMGPYMGKCEMEIDYLINSDDTYEVISIYTRNANPVFEDFTEAGIKLLIADDNGLAANHTEDCLIKAPHLDNVTLPHMVDVMAQLETLTSNYTRNKE